MYKNSTVIELIGSDFNKKDKKISIKNTNSKNGILNIYAPWCSHCVKLAEIYKEISVLFLNKFNFYACNSENKKNFKIINELKIEYYPTLFIVNKQGNIKKIKIPLDKNKLICIVYENLN